MKVFSTILKTVFLLSLILSCSSNSNTSQDDELMELNSLRDEIEQLVASGICTESSDCDFIAFGSEACGGPKSYLVFSNTIDIALLQQKVAIYNTSETAYNLKWNVISDCMYVMPPTEVGCVDGICTVINN